MMLVVATCARPPDAQKPAVPAGATQATSGGTGERRPAGSADVQVTDFSVPVVARVGQTVGLLPPRASTLWTLEFNHDALQLILPEKDGDAPGAGGWVWRARLPGTFEVAVTQHVECKSPPCAPNVARFAFTIEVRPRSAIR